MAIILGYFAAISHDPTIVGAIGGVFSGFLRHFGTQIILHFQIGGRGVLFRAKITHTSHVASIITQNITKHPVFASKSTQITHQFPNRGEGGLIMRCFLTIIELCVVLCGFVCVLHQF